MFGWFDTKECERFGHELALQLYAVLKEPPARAAKAASKMEKALTRAAADVREFKECNRLNVYKRSKLANSFLWTLRDAGCATERAQELTEWLTLRL